eukprot:6192018-Pleurochrysis_carterae.AAC.1
MGNDGTRRKWCTQTAEVQGGTRRCSGKEAEARSAGRREDVWKGEDPSGEQVKGPSPSARPGA